jgi:hypothetical protein
MTPPVPPLVSNFWIQGLGVLGVLAAGFAFGRVCLAIPRHRSEPQAEIPAGLVVGAAVNLKNYYGFGIVTAIDRSGFVLDGDDNNQFPFGTTNIIEITQAQHRDVTVTTAITEKLTECGQDSIISIPFLRGRLVGYIHQVNETDVVIRVSRTTEEVSCREAARLIAIPFGFISCAADIIYKCDKDVKVNNKILFQTRIRGNYHSNYSDCRLVQEVGTLVETNKDCFKVRDIGDFEKTVSWSEVDGCVSLVKEE